MYQKVNISLRNDILPNKHTGDIKLCPDFFVFFSFQKGVFLFLQKKYKNTNLFQVVSVYTKKYIVIPKSNIKFLFVWEEPENTVSFVSESVREFHCV